jgi:hypothetical protein
LHGGRPHQAEHWPDGGRNAEALGLAKGVRKLFAIKERADLQIGRAGDGDAFLLGAVAGHGAGSPAGGFVNKTGVWGPDEQPVYDAMEDSPLTWHVGPDGQHIEMGIAEMNLVLLLGQLGLSWDHQRERLFPFGTVYGKVKMLSPAVVSGAGFLFGALPSSGRENT